MLADTVESKSLVEDMTETVERMYHRDVACVQRETHDAIADCLAKEEEAIERYIEINKCDFEEAEEWVKVAMDDFIKRKTLEADQVIEALKGLRDYRLVSIQKICSQS